MAAERNLVFWPKENAWSVVSKSAISDSDNNVGSLTSAKYGGKLYPALIIARGSDKILNVEGQKFQTFLNEILFEETDEAAIIRRVKEEYNLAESKSSVADNAPTQNSDDTASTQNSDDTAPTQNSDDTTPTRNSDVTKLTAPTQNSDDTKLPAAVDIQVATNVSSTSDSVTAESSANTKASDADDKRNQPAAESPFIKKRAHESSSHKSSRTKLERDVDYLMGEVKRLKGRVKKLEHVGSPETQKMETQKMETQKMESKEAKTCQPQETTSSVVQIIEGSNNVSQAITTLLKTLFTNEELKSCSITGKKSPKCIGQPRPPLDQGKFEKLCECVRAKFPGTEKKIIIEKIQNIQKVLRRQ